MSEEAIVNAEGDGTALERRELTLRGREAPLAVRVASHINVGGLAPGGAI